MGCFVEHAGDVLPDVVLQMETQVFDSLVSMVILGVVGGAVHNVSDTDFAELRPVRCDQVRAQIQETVDDLRANTFVKFVLVFFTGRALEIEIFVGQLIRGDLEVFLADTRVTLTLRLDVGALGNRRRREFVVELFDILLSRIESMALLLLGHRESLLLNTFRLGQIQAETHLGPVAVRASLLAGT